MSPSRHPSASSPERNLWLPFTLLLLAIVLRVVKGTEFGQNWLPNFSPWMALAFAGTALFPRILPWWLPVAALFLSDVVIHGHELLTSPTGMIAMYACFAVAALTAVRLRNRIGALGLVGGTLGFGLVFYLVTNTLAWAALPEYAKNLAGWMQAQTIGLPGFPPTWTFLRNSLLSDAGFAALLILAYNAEAARRRTRPLTWRMARAST